GDIIEGDRQDAEMSVLEQSLRKITAKYGVYAVFGNHELHGGINSPPPLISIDPFVPMRYDPEDAQLIGWRSSCKAVLEGKGMSNEATMKERRSG
ncbi:MAG: hypothetical protein WCK00_07245, partial [Deltaproteobacteria bacterium]